MLTDFKYLAFKQQFSISKVSMITKLFLQICQHLYGTAVELLLFVLC